MSPSMDATDEFICQCFVDLREVIGTVLFNGVLTGACGSDLS